MIIWRRNCTWSPTGEHFLSVQVPCLGSREPADDEECKNRSLFNKTLEFSAMEDNMKFYLGGMIPF
jgi:hypothetical protein